MYIQIVLKSRNILEIITEIKDILAISVKSVFYNLNTNYISYFQRQTLIKGIFILNINSFILIDKCIISLVKKL